MADSPPRTEMKVTTGPIRGSRKIHVGPLRVAMREIVADIERSAGIADLFGLASLAIGVAILIPHHLLYDPLSIVVTLIALLSLLEGLLLLAFPDILLALARPFVAATRLWAIAVLIAGVLLFLAGFTGRADALP